MLRGGGWLVAAGGVRRTSAVKLWRPPAWLSGGGGPTITGELRRGSSTVPRPAGSSTTTALGIALDAREIALGSALARLGELSSTFEEDLGPKLGSKTFKKGENVRSATFTRANVPNMSLWFYPLGNGRAEDGYCSLYLYAPAGWRLRFKLSVSGNGTFVRCTRSMPTFGGDIEEWGWKDFQKVGSGSRVAVEILEAEAPEGQGGAPCARTPEVQEPIDREALVARAVAARQAESDLELALAALLRLQSKHPDALVRAACVKPGISYDRDTLLQELRRVGANAPDASDSAADPIEQKLAAIIGLEPIKDQVRDLKLRLEVNRRKAELGAPVLGAGPLHMVFSGNPGCGKTTIARVVAQMLCDMKVVQGSSFVEVQRGDLVAEYVGHTAVQTRSKIQQAKGGILFVDEAYRLSNTGSERDFGKEAIEEIMKDLTTGDPLVCLAGYPNEMHDFLETNPGLKRRFPMVFAFPDYSPRELADMFLLKAADAGFKLGASTSVEAITDLIEEHTTPTWRAERNGGIAESLLRKVDQALTYRLRSDFTKDEAETIELLDVRLAAAELMDRSRL